MCEGPEVETLKTGRSGGGRAGGDERFGRQRPGTMITGKFGMTLGLGSEHSEVQKMVPKLPLLFAVLEARVRQLQAENTSQVMVKKVPMDRPLKSRSGRWAQKLEAEKQVKQKSQEGVLDQQKQSYTLHTEPRVWSKKLASCLQQSKKGAPKSSEEEEQQLTRALQAALLKLSSRTPARTKAQVVETNFLLLQQKFLAFFECCACTDNMPLAHHVLVTHHSKCERQQLLTLDMYNTVMLGWARKVSLVQVLRLFR